MTSQPSILAEHQDRKNQNFSRCSILKRFYWQSPTHPPTPVLEIVLNLFFLWIDVNVNLKFNQHYLKKTSAMLLFQGKVTTNTEFNLWCFHPGFSLQSLVRCNIRTMILTSGTLKPLESVRFEALMTSHKLDPIPVCMGRMTAALKLCILWLDGPTSLVHL